MVRFTFPFIILLLLSGCGSDEDEPTNEVGQVSFNLTEVGDFGGRTTTTGLIDADAILVTIREIDGSSTEYELERIELYELNGEYVSRKISLTEGSYEVTELLVIDKEDNILYVAPLENSDQAQNVNEPLPIDFEVRNNEITGIDIEVLSVKNLSIQEFGLAGFSLQEVGLLQFIITVAEQGNQSSILSAQLKVSNGDYVYTQELMAISNNIVTVKDGFESYELMISKDGYQDYSLSLSKGELEEFSSTPLIIELSLIPTEWIPGMDITDERDGQIYKTVQIGEQVWLAENLRAELYNDGSSIEFPGTDIVEWEGNTSGAFAWYNNNETSYGGLYNWFAVDTEKLCPIGWHIPSDEEWLELSTYLGGSSVAGSKMKETGTENWNPSNEDATNSSGFSAIPAGWAYFCCGHFSHQGDRAAFWSSDEGINEDHGISYQLMVNEPELIRYTSSNSSNKGNGFSVRCIKD